MDALPSQYLDKYCENQTQSSEKNTKTTINAWQRLVCSTAVSPPNEQ